MKSRFQRILASALAVLTMSSLLPLQTLAAERSQAEYIEKDMYVVAKYGDAAVEAIADGLFNHSSVITTIRRYNVLVSDFGSLYSAVLAKYPELFYVDRAWGYSTFTSNDSTYIYRIVPQYNMDAEEAAEKMDAFYREADFYLDQVDEELSACRDDFSKAVTLHDEIALDAYYDDVNYYNSNYTFMIDKYGVCENYTRIYAYLLGQLGIYSEIIDCDDLKHEWLKIKLNDTYYNVDVTWDDPPQDRPGQVLHNNFLMSDNKRWQTIYNSYGVDAYYDSYYPSDDTTYDQALYTNYYSKMCKLDADTTTMYAVNRGTKQIVSYNYVTDTETPVYNINATWYAGGGYYYGGAYSSLEIYNGKLYYNTPGAIYSFDPKTNETELVYTNTENTSLYGLRIRGRNLYGIFANSPDVTGQAVLVAELPEIHYHHYSDASWLWNGDTAELVMTCECGDTVNIPATVTLDINEASYIATAEYNGTTYTDTKPIDALENVSELSASTINLGDTVTVYADAQGGLGTYEYAVQYKKATDTKWTTVQNYSTNDTVTIRPAKTAPYEIRVTAKDELENTAEKVFAVTVNPPLLVNTSEVDKTTVPLGQNVTVTASATGGTAPYTYAVYYKKANDTKWTTAQAYGTNNTVTVTPLKKTTYQICVKVKDKKGNVAEQVFEIAVTDALLTNTSTLSADTVTLGQAVTVNASATGGKAPYKYAVQYKRSVDTKWTSAQAYETNSTITVTPKKKTAYDICVKVKDSKGNVEERYFTVNVQ